MASIAFIGLGNMGGPMAANLVKAGHKVVAFDLVEASRNQSKADGAAIADSAVAAVKGAEVVITMLPAGRHVLSVWTEILPSMAKELLIIDCSTIDVESSVQAHALAAKQGIASVDAPVSGGTGGAKGATLTFMAGGEAKAFAAAQPVLEKMGKKIVHCGGAGAGQAAKICNNMILGISMIAVSEAFALAEKLWTVASGPVRRRLDLVRTMLVADDLLSGAGSGADLAREQRVPAGLCVGLDDEGPHARAGRGQGGRCSHAAWQACTGNLPRVRRRRKWRGRFLRNYPACSRIGGEIMAVIPAQRLRRCRWRCER